MRRFATTSVLAVVMAVAGCEKPADKADAPDDRADAQAVDVAYRCQDGKGLTARYPDARTAIVTYEGQTFTLTLAESASGSRFTGGGREWWIKAYPDREEGTLSPTGAAAGGTPIATCSRGAPPAPTTGPEFNPSIPPKESDAAPGQPGNDGGPTPVLAPPCRSGDLSLRRVGEDAGAGQRAVTYAFVNNARTACSLKGFPTLSWYDENGKALPNLRVIQSEASMFDSSGPPTEVQLAPGARAVFHIGFSGIQQGSRPCPVSARLQATPPENSQILELDDRISPCAGQVRVGPVRADTAAGTSL